MNLNEPSVVLTGAGGGIGGALAMRLATYGARFTLVGRRAEPLEQLAVGIRANGGQAAVVPVDLTAPGAPDFVIARAVEEFGGVDVLVNNAGNIRGGRLETLDEPEIRVQIALNLTAPILLTRAALAALRSSGAGLVVNVSSGMGLVGMPFYATYGATKAGIAHFGEAMRRELYGEGVHVLNIYPAATATPMMQTHAGVTYEDPDAVAAETVAGMAEGALDVIFGGSERRALIAANRNDPAVVDQTIAARKSELERLAREHASL